jgi:hypothetical protein
LAARDLAKFILDLVKNAALLGGLKYFADKSQSKLLDEVYTLAGAALVVFCMSYFQTWRPKFVSAFVKRPFVDAIDTVLRSSCRWCW